MILRATVLFSSESNQQAHTIALTAKLITARDGGLSPWRGLHLMNRAIPIAFATFSRCVLATADVIFLLTPACKCQ